MDVSKVLNSIFPRLVSGDVSRCAVVLSLAINGVFKEGSGESWDAVLTLDEECFSNRGPVSAECYPNTMMEMALIETVNGNADLQKELKGSRYGKKLLADVAQFLVNKVSFPKSETDRDWQEQDSVHALEYFDWLITNFSEQKELLETLLNALPAGVVESFVLGKSSVQPSARMKELIAKWAINKHGFYDCYELMLKGREAASTETDAAS